jgi:hypothetical protein
MPFEPFRLDYAIEARFGKLSPGCPHLSPKLGRFQELAQPRRQ